MKVPGSPGINKAWNGSKAKKGGEKKHPCLCHPDMQGGMYMFPNAFLCSIDTEHMTLLLASQ